MKTVLLAACVLGLAVGCGAQAAPPGQALSPAQAISAAAKDKDGAAGVFAFKVVSTGGGARGRAVFLNSLADYHDPRNLSVMLKPAAVKSLEAELGAPLVETLKGKHIRVTGVARQARINVYGPDNKRTGETETQTRITVETADSLEVK